MTSALLTTSLPPSNTCQSSQISQWALCLSKRGKHTTALSRRRARPLLETGGRQLPRKSLALLLCQRHFFLSGHLRLEPSPKTSSLFTLPQSLAPSSRPSPFQLFSVLSLCLTKQDRACSLYTAKKKIEKKENREGCLGEGDRGRLNLFWILPLHPPPSQCGNYPSSLTSAGSLFKSTSPLWCFVHRNHGFHLLLNRRHHRKKNLHAARWGGLHVLVLLNNRRKKVWPLSVISFFFYYYYLEFEEDKKRSSEHHLQLIILCACIIIKQTDRKLLRLLL